MRASLISRLALLGAAAVTLPTLFACLEHKLVSVEYEPEQEDMEGIAISINKDVDILFVIDNSGSMGEEQQNLSQNFGRFLEVLEAEDVAANYRIGITTTDNGNPWCAGLGAAAGNLVLSNCLSRLPGFVFDGEMPIDQTAACTDYCTTDDIPVLPTTTVRDPNPAPRPWLEKINGVANIPAEISTTTALQCFGPQGINGCGFESHLESMYKALTRAGRQEEASYGFLRDAAILSIVFVTDEADCSYNDDHNAIFLPANRGGNPETLAAFWSDPAAPSPTSAVCWNAGVTCTGSGIYDACNAVDKDELGNPVAPETAASDAVLRPIQRYIDLVQEIEDRKKSINPDQEVLIAAISGVPTTYPTSALQYSDTAGVSNDPNFVGNFGVGPGCSSSVAEAVPPVRLRDFAAAFGSVEGSLFSVCNEDYGPALQAIADQIRDQIRPACMPTCVADGDAVTTGLQPQCILEKRVRLETGEELAVDIPKCVIDGGGAEVPPAGEFSCYVELTTPETMDPQCVDDGWNLEFRLIELPNPDVPVGVSSRISATCQLSQNRSLDCPNLP